VKSGCLLSELKETALGPLGAAACKTHTKSMGLSRVEGWAAARVLGRAAALERC